MDLEKKLKEIEDIASKLESPDLGLDEGIKLYENGIKVAKDALAELDSVKGRVNIIKKELDAYKEEALD